ncbi:rhomboid family intramembrane serine protease [Clostridium tetani]|uniref:rhomboid family intramembrane serine protease n=1 Tax=Clostridium tetani TaxID=1513 RepID=UPI00100A626C|nr:rhomboid family intramembrane serine protease [Clostridium tetani]RXI40836.1 rhomboid family intramembrane serine protease [Clostridium tetani]
MQINNRDNRYAFDEAINFIIESSVKALGYSLFELNNIDNETILSPWMLVRFREDINEVIIFCSEKYNSSYDYDTKLSIVESLQNKFPNLSIYNITLIKIKFGGSVPNNGNYFEENCVLVNLSEKKIIQYSNGLEDLIEIIRFYMNNTYSRENGNKKIKRFIKENTITFILISMNIIMYFITALLSGNIIDSNINVLIFLGAKVNPLIDRGQYYRLLTCIFLHGGLIHLGLNIYALSALGPLVEKIYGKFKYLAIYFLSGICSSLLSYFMSSSISIGASGAIFGLLGACLVISLKYKDRVGKVFVNNIISVIFVNLIIGFSVSNVDNFGHIGGLIGGVLISTLICK